MEEPVIHELSGAVASRISRMRIDAATAEVLRAFSATGVHAFLLKGPSLEAWLYPSGDRPVYLDTDLLIRPGDEGRAGETLRKLGFEPVLDAQVLPEWWREHGSEWLRATDGVVVDIHQSLPGIGVNSERMWRTLAVRADTVPVAGYAAPTLALPARALHVALHAAHNGPYGLKALEDLDRALEVGDETLWENASALARDVEAVDAFAAGLRLRPAGGALAERLNLPAGGSVEVALRANTAPPIALGFEQVARAGSWRARVEIIWRKLIPPPAFVRHWWPPAARNSLMLALGYVYRPLWLLKNTPRGLRAWRRARGRVRAGR